MEFSVISNCESMGFGVNLKEEVSVGGGEFRQGEWIFSAGNNQLVAEMAVVFGNTDNWNLKLRILDLFRN